MFRIGKNLQDRMFTKNDYSLFSRNNIFTMNDAAYIREFYILHNPYGIGLASGRKNKILSVKVPLPFSQYQLNFMDKERTGLIACSLSRPRQAILRRAMLGALMDYLERRNLEETSEDGFLNFDPTNSMFQVDCYSFNKRKLVSSSQLYKLLGLKSYRVDAEWSVTCFEDLIVLFIDGYIFQLVFSQETEQFSFASNTVFKLTCDPLNSKFDPSADSYSRNRFTSNDR